MPGGHSRADDQDAHFVFLLPFGSRARLRSSSPALTGSIPRSTTTVGETRYGVHLSLPRLASAPLPGTAKLHTHTCRRDYTSTRTFGRTQSGRVTSSSLRSPWGKLHEGERFTRCQPPASGSVLYVSVSLPPLTRISPASQSAS